jgi:hypothetical protein
MKFVQRSEMKMFLELAPHYFEYMFDSVFENRPSVLVKTLGAYELSWHQSDSGNVGASDLSTADDISDSMDSSESNLEEPLSSSFSASSKTTLYMFVMPNVTYESGAGDGIHIFDLKGSVRNRYINIRPTSGIMSKHISPAVSRADETSSTAASSRLRRGTEEESLPVASALEVIEASTVLRRAVSESIGNSDESKKQGGVDESCSSSSLSATVSRRISSEDSFCDGDSAEGSIVGDDDDANDDESGEEGEDGDSQEEGEDQKVLLDLNFVECKDIYRFIFIMFYFILFCLFQVTNGFPVGLSSDSHEILRQAVHNDSQFLSSHEIVDYSLLVALDLRRHREGGFFLSGGAVFVGIIDYIRQYTWDKRLESGVGAIMPGSKGAPTVISPASYRDRFRLAMARYFMNSPPRNQFGNASSSSSSLVLVHHTQLQQQQFMRQGEEFFKYDPAAVLMQKQQQQNEDASSSSSTKDKSSATSNGVLGFVGKY